MYGKPNGQQQRVIARYVKGLRVHDLGAGDLRLSRRLLALGASSVVAVDTKLPYQSPDARIELLQRSFNRLADEPVAVAFVSWPQNYWSQIEVPLRLAKCIIYLGKNSDGTACGDSKLFDLLRTRRVLAHVPDKRNTLIAYGAACRPRKMLPEEWAATEGRGHCWPYDELMSRGEGQVVPNALCSRSIYLCHYCYGPPF